MTPFATAQHDAPSHRGWFSSAESWLDSKGKGAWIAAMILGFVFFWPVGLALLFYMIWSKRMFKKSHGCGMRSTAYMAMKPSGNAAFDAYKADTLNRLEQEQQAFDDFMERLRAAKDKAEFDQFMDERAEAAKSEKDEAA